MSSSEEISNKVTFKRFVDANNTGDLALVSKLIDEVVATGVQFHAPVPVGATGQQALKQVMASLYRGFPDLHLALEDMIAEEDKVVGRQTVTGTHRGEYMGLPATGKSVVYDEIFIFRFANSRIVEIWGVVDVFSQMKQLGVIPAGPTPTKSS
jgi:steroid delta-isomerase-like uncharacterized protein